jgi:hypothetical protein
MDESPIALRRTIEDTKEELSHDIDVLEAKGKELVDWRAHVDKRPLAMLGVAFVGGALAAAIVGDGGGSRRRSGEAFASGELTQDRPRRESNEAWDRLRSGVSAAAAGIAMEAISKAFPEVRKHVIDPARSALRKEQPAKPWNGAERRFTGLGQAQGNGNSV